MDPPLIVADSKRVYDFHNKIGQFLSSRIHDLEATIQKSRLKTESSSNSD